MGKQILSDCRIFAVGTDLTGVTNKVELDDMIEPKEVTNFGSGRAKEVIAGLASCKVTCSGQHVAGDLTTVDDAMWAARASNGIGPWSVTPNTAGVGDLVYLTRALRASYKVGAAVGDVLAWDASAESSRFPLARGMILHPPGTARTATGTGTGVELGAVPAAQRLFANLHLLSAAGTTPSITVTVESDSSNAFGSPTTVATFTAATGISGQSVRASGYGTDTWFRTKWTITGTGPSFLFVVSLGTG